MLDTIKTISIRSNVRRYDKVNAYSKDQQPAIIAASVTYSVPENKVEELYTRFSTIEQLLNTTLDRQINNQIENIFGQYSAVEVVTNREKFVAAVEKNIKTSLANAPLVINSVQIENIDFSSAYEKSIELRMQAEVEVETLRQNLSKERIAADITVTKAKAEADSSLARAKADAEATFIKGEAEAKAIEIKALALSKNQEYVKYLAAQQWNGVLPTTMLPNAALPMLDLR